MIKVSIIMPSLNVASYIRETMDSVISQTLKEIEIICVDAGSTDGTLEILKEYASSDDRIRVILSEKKSYGYQMNLGISAATGEYIGIVETDDYVEPDMYEKLFDAAEKNNADIVKGDFDLFTKGSDGIRLYVPYSLKRYNRNEYGKIYSADDYLSDRIKPECYIWDAIYKRSFLLNNDIVFNETPGASFQDFSFRYQTMYQAERIMAIEGVLYHYRRENDKASTYDARTAEFNYRETEYSIKKLKERGVISDGLPAAFIREMIEYAFWPYVDMRKWVMPSDSTLESFERYRGLFIGLINNGSLCSKDLPYDLRIYLDCLIEGADFFMKYAEIVAGVQSERDVEFLKIVIREKKIILFGSGVRGNAIYAFLKGNGVDSIVAFCDNNTNKQSTKNYGVGILSPEDAVKNYTDALFILTSPALEDEAKKQLADLGVGDNDILSYRLSTTPHFCTNCMVKNRLDSLC